MGVLNAVYSVGDILPLILYIEVDNCAHENKFLIGLCTTLVGLGYFEEVRVGFFLGGQMHSDINQ
jgi:hypothetical protein